MLFLIRYMFYRHYDSADKSHLGDINLLVVDTEKFPAHTFIRDSDLIQAFKGFDNREKNGLLSLASLRDTSHYFGEYLSQGSLQISGKCSTISARTMLHLQERIRRSGARQMSEACPKCTGHYQSDPKDSVSIACIAG